MVNEICLSDLYLDLADSFILSISRDEVVTQVNRKGCEILGFDREQVIGRNWFESFLPQRLREELRSGFHNMLDKSVFMERHQNPVMTSSGQERVIAWHNMVVRDVSGTATGTLSSGEDITERLDAEKALKESELTSGVYSIT